MQRVTKLFRNVAFFQKYVVQSLEARGRSHDKLGFSVRAGAIFPPRHAGTPICALQDSKIVSELTNKIG